MKAQRFIPLVARAFLVAIFFRSGIGKILDFTETQDQIAGQGLPLAGLLTVGAIVFELLGLCQFCWATKPAGGRCC